MNEFIIDGISEELKINKESIISTLKLLKDDNTIPFIARYRKEVTGNLDEEEIRKIDEVYRYQESLFKRKNDVIRLIDEKGLLTDELKFGILKCSKLIEVEDLYRPYKEKKKTKATEAIKQGLEPLAKSIMLFKLNFDYENEAEKYINENIKTKEDALLGATHIIAEWISDNASYRRWIRRYIYNNGLLLSKKKEKATDENNIYEMYYDYSEPIKHIKEHRVLAVNRGEKEGILTVSIKVDDEVVLNYLEKNIIKNYTSKATEYVITSIKDSYKRLIKPSIDREIRADIKEKSENRAIEVFGKNLEKLLLQPPMKEKVVLGLDPAYRTGCKLAVVDSISRVLDISVIYPHEPKNKWNDSKEIIKNLVKKYNVDIIAIGNGTASRESEKLVAETINEITDKRVEYIIVSEAGASVYSASKLAISEFPDLHVEQRSAISIARRLQDPLSELVKIDAKSIGVGLYQHDVNTKKLDESLNFVVSSAVNNVGVNINSASASILKYVSGLSKSVIDKIIAYRNKMGKINSRSQLKELKSISDKVYEQSIGFIRIIDGDNPLDMTSIHPESYNIALQLIKDLNCNIADIGSDKLSSELKNINIDEYSLKNNIDKYTLEDIIKCLQQPNRDYRDMFDKPLLKSDIITLDNLAIGMKLQGTVRNVVDFGVFIDIGLKNDGLAHISKLSNNYINHPLDVVSVGDIVDCYVEDIIKDKGKVSLSLLEPSLKN
ncbi:MAG: Tex family protein [bacterium]|nr:Tex family protein [bacterium]